MKSSQLRYFACIFTSYLSSPRWFRYTSHIEARRLSPPLEAMLLTEENGDVTSRHINIFKFVTIIGRQNIFSMNAENFSLKVPLSLQHWKPAGVHLYSRYVSALFFYVYLWRIINKSFTEHGRHESWSSTMLFFFETDITDEDGGFK